MRAFNSVKEKVNKSNDNEEVKRINKPNITNLEQAPDKNCMSTSA
jgi:hypothetical protein